VTYASGCMNIYACLARQCILICRAAVEAMRSWLRLQEYHFAIAGGIEPYDEQVEVAEIKVK
jgi:hypothetical protein